MKLRPILEGLFIQQIITASEALLEKSDDKGEVTLRIVPVQFGRKPSPGEDLGAVALDFFYTPDPQSKRAGDFARFEVRTGDGSGRQFFSLKLEAQGEVYADGVEKEYFFICENPEEEGEAYAQRIAQAMCKLFFEFEDNPELSLQFPVAASLPG